VDWGTGITVLVTVLVATSGYIVTYLNNVRLSQRKEQLDRIEKQLRELYGPLFALHRTTAAAWASFRSTYRKGNITYWSASNPPNDKEKAAWRLWMTEVFMPINEQMVQLIHDHADLLEEPELPNCLLQLSAHVAAQRAILKAWQTEDYSRHTSVTNYPHDELEKYTQRHYERLQRMHAEVIGTIYGDWEQKTVLPEYLVDHRPQAGIKDPREQLKSIRERLEQEPKDE
jgi:hypothetical protein